MGTTTSTVAASPTHLPPLPSLPPHASSAAAPVLDDVYHLLHASRWTAFDQSVRTLCSNQPMFSTIKSDCYVDWSDEISVNSSVTRPGGKIPSVTPSAPPPTVVVDDAPPAWRELCRAAHLADFCRLVRLDNRGFIDAALADHALEMVVNNPVTGNMTGLLSLLIKSLNDWLRQQLLKPQSRTPMPGAGDHSDDHSDNHDIIFTIVLVRVFLRHFISILDVFDLASQLDSTPVTAQHTAQHTAQPSAPCPHLVQLLLRTCYDVIAYCPITTNTYFPVMEVFNLLLVFYSTTLFTITNTAQLFIEVTLTLGCVSPSPISSLHSYAATSLQPLPPSSPVTAQNGTAQRRGDPSVYAAYIVCRLLWLALLAGSSIEAIMTDADQQYMKHLSKQHRSLTLSTSTTSSSLSSSTSSTSSSSANSSLFFRGPAAMLRVLGATASAIIFLPFNALSWFFTSSAGVAQPGNIAQLALALLHLLVFYNPSNGLTHHLTTTTPTTTAMPPSADRPDDTIINPFRYALNSLRNGNLCITTLAPPPPPSSSSLLSEMHSPLRPVVGRITFPFSDLYDAIASGLRCHSSHDDAAHPSPDPSGITTTAAAGVTALGGSSVSPLPASLHYLSDGCTFLLYRLCHENRLFAYYSCNARSDIEALVAPLLRCLYLMDKEGRVGTTNDSSHSISKGQQSSTVMPPSFTTTSSTKVGHDQANVVLATLLLLSQSAAFNERLHESVIATTVTWFSDRVLHDITLGLLLIIVYVKIILNNLSSVVDDSFLILTCLTTLVNGAAQCRQLHHYAVQRLVTLVDLIAKRCGRLCRKVYDDDRHMDMELSKSNLKIESNESLDATCRVYRQVLVLSLRIIAKCVYYSDLIRNPNLVYGLVHRQDAFTILSTPSIATEESQSKVPANEKAASLARAISLSDVDGAIATEMACVDAALTFFNDRISKMNHAEMSPADVISIIRSNTMHWKSLSLVSDTNNVPTIPDSDDLSPDFIYVEESWSAEFFNVAIWRWIVKEIPSLWSQARVNEKGDIVINTDQSTHQPSKFPLFVHYDS